MRFYAVMVVGYLFFKCDSEGLEIDHREIDAARLLDAELAAVRRESGNPAESTSNRRTAYVVDDCVAGGEIPKREQVRNVDSEIFSIRTKYGGIKIRILIVAVPLRKLGKR